MGQQQSQEHHNTEESSKISNHNNDDSELSNVEQEIQKLRQELLELKQEGVQKKQQYREEYKTVNSQFNDSLRRFHECDREATSLFQFWDYLDIIQQEEQKDLEKKQETQTGPSSTPANVVATPSPPTITTATTTSSSSSSTTHASSKKPSTTALSKTTLSTISTQFCMDLIRIFQSYLLRKLHMVMMLEKQKGKQAKGWNKIVLWYYECAQDKAGKVFQKTRQHVSETLQEIKIRKQERQDVMSKILDLQQELLNQLEVLVSSSQEAASKTTRQPQRRRSSIEDIRQSKRELEMLRYTISPNPLPRKVVDVTIQLVASTTSLESEEESKEDEESPSVMDELQWMPHHRRSSIKDIKARNRELEQNRPKTLSPNNSHDDEPNVVAI